MSVVRSQKDRPLSYLKFLLACAGAAVSIGVFYFLFTHWFMVAIDDQKIPCLGHHVYLVSKGSVETNPVKGDAYAFEVRVSVNGKQSLRLWAKRLAAVPGDKVEITPQGSLFINDFQVRDSMPLLEKFGKNPGNYAVNKVLGKDEFFFLGDTPTSFDSRYWGTVKRAQLRGKVVAGIF